MSRTKEYIPPIAVVYTGVQVNNIADLSKTGTEEKEKSPFTMNIEHRKKRKYEVKPVDNNIRKHSPLPKPVKKYKKTKSNDPKVCKVCFVRFKTLNGLAMHMRHNNQRHKCDGCDAVFAVGGALLRHKATGGCKRKFHYNFWCNFCSRVCKWKSEIQSHLFHLHGDLIYSDETEVEDTISKVSENVTVMEEVTKLSDPRTSRPILSNTNDIISKEPSNLKELPSKKLVSEDIVFSEQLNNSSNQHSKKMKQTVITDFIKFHKNELKEEYIVRNDKVSTENALASNSSSNIVSQSTKIANTNDWPPTQKPLVKIHVNSDTMSSLLDMEIKTEPDTYMPYNEPDTFRSTRRRSYKFHGSTDLALSEISETSRKISPKKNKKIDILPRKNKRIQDKEWKVKFNCKECVVQLERCDLKYEKGSFHQVDSKRMIELAEPTTSPRSKIAVKIQPEEYLEFEKPCPPPLSPPPTPPPLRIVEFEEHQDPPENSVSVKSVKRKKYPCRFCEKTFCVKRNKYKHIKLFHTIYASTICNARYKTMKDLLNHYLHQHKALKRKTCCVCNEKFYVSGWLKKHMVLHCVKTVAAENTSATSKNCSKLKKEHACKVNKRCWREVRFKQHGKICREMRNVSMNTQGIVQTESSTSLIADVPENLESVGSSTLAMENSITNFSEETSNVGKTSVEEVQSTKEKSSTVSTNHATTYNATEDKLIEKIVQVKGYHVDATEKKAVCDICGSRFRTFKNLYLHQRTYAQPRNYSCNECGIAFSTKRTLLDHRFATHTDSCSERYELFCKLCNQGFNNQLYLRVHESHFHKDPLHLNSVKHDNLVCKTCNLIFASYKHFIEHNTYYYKNQVFVCKACNKSFQGMYQLHHHSKFVHYPEKTRRSYPYKCNVCEEGFNYEAHLHAHKFHVHSDTISAVGPIQDHNYAQMPSSIAKAEETVQKSLKTYKCSICDLKLVSAKDLAMHEIEYSADGDFLCDKCDRRCQTKSVLAKHYSLNHTGDIKDSVKCACCNEVLTTSTSVRCHAKHFHDSQTSKKSVDIQDTTNSFKHYKDNVDEFEGDSYVCLTCSAKFDSHIDLKDHLVKYSNIGTHRCTICRRKFANKNLVKAHKEKHLELSYKTFLHRCSICNEGFVNSEDIHIHVSHFHRNEKFNIVNKKISDDIDKLNGTNSTENSVSCNEGKKLPENNLSFNSINDLMEYTLQPSENNLSKHKCPFCEELFRSFVGVCSHIQDHHGKEKLPMISKTVNTNKKSNVVNRKKKAANVITNVQNVNTIKKSNVVNCNNKATNVITNVRIINMVKKSNVVNCNNKATNVITNVQNVKKHNNIDEASPEESFHYVCTACNLKLPTLRHFQTHYKEMHDKNRNSSVSTALFREPNNMKIDCTVCNHVSMDEKSFNDHLRLHEVNRDSSSNHAKSKNNDELGVVWNKVVNIPKSMICLILNKQAEQTNVSAMTATKFVNSNNVGKLRVKPFAKISN